MSEGFTRLSNQLKDSNSGEDGSILLNFAHCTACHVLRSPAAAFPLNSLDSCTHTRSLNDPSPRSLSHSVLLLSQMEERTGMTAVASMITEDFVLANVSFPVLGVLSHLGKRSLAAIVHRLRKLDQVLGSHYLPPNAAEHQFA